MFSTAEQKWPPLSLRSPCFLYLVLLLHSIFGKEHGL